jgi:hypothetical protein
MMFWKTAQQEQKSPAFMQVFGIFLFRSYLLVESDIEIPEV